MCVYNCIFFKLNSLSPYLHHSLIVLPRTGSLVVVGMIPGAWLGGWMGTRVGRRHSLMILQVPVVLGWILIALAYNPAMIHVGR